MATKIVAPQSQAQENADEDYFYPQAQMYTTSTAVSLDVARPLL